MPGRYVRVNFTSNWGDPDWIAMSIIHVCDADGVKWNDGGMTYTSSTDGYENYGLPSDVAQAVEQENVFWEVHQPGWGGTTPNPGWWKVDLGQSRLISIVKLRVYNGYDYRNIKDFTVSVSENDSTWTQILSAQTLLQEYDPQIQEFETTDSATQTVIIPAVALVLTACVPHFMIPVAYIPVTSLTLSAPESFRGYARSQAPVADLVLSRHDPSYFFLFASHPPAVSLLLTSRNPSAVWELNAAMFPASQVIYLCTLTGAADGVADVVIPISSFQATLRNGDPSYLACVIPNSTDWEAAVTARPNGEIVIQKGYRLADGSTNLEEIARVDFETVRIDRGARNDSATIVGHKTVTATAPKEWAVQGVSYYALQADGKRRIRAAMDLFLRPGDVVIYGAGDADSFIVGRISYFVYVNWAVMEVSEE